MYTTGAYGVGGANKNRVFTLLDVIEVKPMQTGGGGESEAVVHEKTLVLQTCSDDLS